MDAILEVRNLTKRFRGLLAIDRVSFALERNEILGLIGPNGAGKTTLVSLVSGTLDPAGAEICCWPDVQWVLDAVTSRLNRT